MTSGDTTTANTEVHRTTRCHIYLLYHVKILPHLRQDPQSCQSLFQHLWSVFGRLENSCWHWSWSPPPDHSAHCAHVSPHHPPRVEWRVHWAVIRSRPGVSVSHWWVRWSEFVHESVPWHCPPLHQCPPHLRLTEPLAHWPLSPCRWADQLQSEPLPDLQGPLQKSDCHWYPARRLHFFWWEIWTSRDLNQRNETSNPELPWWNSTKNQQKRASVVKHSVARGNHSYANGSNPPVQRNPMLNHQTNPTPFMWHCMIVASLWQTHRTGQFVWCFDFQSKMMKEQANCQDLPAMYACSFSMSSVICFFKISISVCLASFSLHSSSWVRASWCWSSAMVVAMLWVCSGGVGSAS